MTHARLRPVRSVRSVMTAACVLSAFAACRGLIGYEDGFGFPTDGGGGDAPPDTSRPVGNPSADAASEADGAAPGDDDDIVGPDAGGDAADASLFALCEGVEAGAPSTVTSCQLLSATCGPNRNEDCCTSIPLEAGAYPRYGDDEAQYESKMATVSAFALDKFEVTVARFRAFVQSTSRTPAACSGKNPNNPDDLGWDPSWNGLLPDGPAAYEPLLTRCGLYPTWTDQSSSNDDRPINCITWYEAQAFCIWDHGRLPTLAEWNYAAAGGADLRPYPWGSEPSDASFADYSCDYPPPFHCYDINAIARVGSFPDGGAKWGQLDMAGNVAEWVQDGPDPNLDQGTDCTNCAYLGSPTERIIRGGGFMSFDTDLRSVELRFPDTAEATTRDEAIGLRCARNP